MRIIFPPNPYQHYCFWFLYCVPISDIWDILLLSWFALLCNVRGIFEHLYIFFEYVSRIFFSPFLMVLILLGFCLLSSTGLEYNPIIRLVVGKYSLPDYEVSFIMIIIFNVQRLLSLMQFQFVYLCLHFWANSIESLKIPLDPM